MKIDLSAREAHFLDHLAPVWRALPQGIRGTIHVGTEDLLAQALELGDDVVVEWPRRAPKLGPILVASWGDLRICSRTRRALILFEHGAGQTYGTRHPSYAGGTGREKVKLFIVPNEQAAARNRRYYPSTPSVAVGSPHVDELLEIEPPSGPPVAAVSFHWRCSVNPETGSGIDDFAPELEATRRKLELEGVELIGHAHPRILEEAREVYTAAGIETVASFVDVVRRAHVYAVDNSSTLFEFAALDRPVVVLNPFAYRRSAAHGLRFWTEADVGLHAAPGDLAARLLEALEDPADVAGSRRAAVARAYAVADGSSAVRAASAIVNLVGRRRGCLVCGAAHSKCGPTTDVVGIDENMKERVKMAGKKKRYPNPARSGAFLNLSDEAAARMGLTGGEVVTRRRAPKADVTNDGGAPIVSSTTVAPDRPKGALAPGGPTSRARRRSAEPEVEVEVAASDEVEVEVEAPAPAKATKKATSRRRPAPKAD